MSAQRVAAWTSRSRNLAVVTTKVAEEVRDLLKTRGPRFELDLCGTVSSKPLPSSDESSANSVRDSAEYRGRHRPQAGLSGVRYELMQV